VSETVTQEILLKIAANTDAAAKALEKLGEKGEKESKKLIKGFADFQAAIDLAGKAIGFASDAAEKFGKTTQLQAAAAGISIAGLREATQGLLTDQQLLELAAKANAGAFKLTQAELEGMGRGMVALTTKGAEMGDVLNKTTKFLVEGNAGGFKEFGLQVRGATGSVEAFRSGMGAVIAEGEKAGSTLAAAGNGFQQAGVSIQNAMDSITNALGRMAVQLAPLITKLARFIELASRMIDPESYYKSLGVNTVEGSGGFFKPLFFEKDQTQLVNTFLELGFGQSRRDAEARASQERMVQQEEALRRGTEATNRALGIFGKAAGQIGKKGGGSPLGASASGDLFAPAASELQGLSFQQMIERSQAGRSFGGSSVEDSLGGVGALPGDLTGPGGGPINRGFLSRNVLDPLKQQVDQFGLPEYIETLNLGAQAFGTFQSAAVQALTAVALGTESLGGALKKLGATMLVSVGQQLLGTAIQEGVMALVSLATPYGAPSAVLHAKAAAAAGAGAVAVFGLARALGVGGAGAGASRAAPATAGLGGAGAGAGGGGGTNTTNIIAGAEWASFSPSQRRSATRRTLEQAGVSNDPNATVVFA
jgi:hypothetical protein